MSRQSSNESLLIILIITAIISAIVAVIKYIAISIAIVAAVVVISWSLYRIFLYCYIGSIKNKEADPLLTTVSKWIVNKDRVYVSDLEKQFSVGPERCTFIITQLGLLGMLNGSECLVNNKWALRKIFIPANSDALFFEHCLDKRVSSIMKMIENQLNEEQCPNTIYLLQYYKKYIDKLLHISYLEERKASLLSYYQSHEIRDIDSDISKYKTDINGAFLNFKIDDKAQKIYDRLCKVMLSINGKDVWDNNHQKIKCERKKFLCMHINNVEASFPCLRINQHKVIYFFPAFIMVFNDKRNNKFFKCIDYKQLATKLDTVYLTKENWFNENDLEVAYYTYLHSRVDGGPDRRYKYNPSTAHYLCHQWSINSIGMELLFSNGNVVNAINGTINQLGVILKNSKLSLLNDYTSCDLESKDDQSKSRMITNTMGKVNHINMKIENAIKSNHISQDTLQLHTLAYILNDLHVFQTIEEKAYFNIMKALIADGILERLVSISPYSLEGEDMIRNYVMKSGYDLTKIRSVITGVYSGFHYSKITDKQVQR